jgi:L-malate glycosyltransferase
VLLATRNGAATLPHLLECYCRLRTPPGGWKVVVVDNGSTDQTAAIVRSYQHRLPLTCLHESRPGKNMALNTGLESTTGDLVVLTDDDALPHVDWLLEMREAADGHKDYAVFGGVILPKWEVAPDPWITDWVPLGPAFSVSDASVPEGPTTAHNVFGPNMAVRAEIFTRGYRFDTEIGPRGANYPMGSETEFVRGVLRDGAKAWYCRRATVEHFIPRSHMSRSWILGRAVRFGRGQYRLGAREREKMVPSWAGVPRFIFRQLLQQFMSMLLALMSGNRERLFRARWQFNYLWGQMIEARAPRT